MRQLYPFFSLGLILLAGCGGGKHDTAAKETAANPVAVSLVEAKSTALVLTHDVPGTVRAAVSTTVSSKVMGFVRDVRVRPGDTVRQGQLLVVVDARDLDSAVQQAQAGEREARSGVAEADNGIVAAKAQLGLAQVTFRRMEDLFHKKSVSNQEFDEAQARLKSAEAAVQMAISKRAQLDARIAQATQGVETASVVRSYSEIQAPFGGIVTERKVEPGQMATPGAPLVTIEQAGAYRLEAAVEESLLGTVKLGQTVSMLFEAAPGETVSGKIVEIVPVIDPVSRSFLVKVSLPSKPAVRSGLFGRLRLPGGQRDAVVVPVASVVERGSLQSIFVVDGKVARNRMVTLGQRQDGMVEVLSGLKAGERIVSPRVEGLTDGAPVEAR